MRHTKVLGLLSILFLMYNGIRADQPIWKMTAPHKIQEIELKFNLKPGDKYLFSSIVKQDIIQEMMGQKVVTKQDMSSDYIYDVQTVEDGITAINVTLSAIKMDTDVAGGMQQLHFDSNNPDASTGELKVLSNLVGKSFRMHINKEGKVESIEGLAEIIGSVDDQHAEILKQSFGDSSMIQSMNQITNIYPNKTVGKGDNWTKSSSGSIAGMLHSTATSEFSLSDITGNSAFLAVDGQMVFSKLEDGNNPLLQGAEFDLNGTQKGMLEVDVKSGLPVRTALKQDISGTLEIQGMQIPMRITSDITITGKKL
ncbi:DUF6263 family protein [Parapedobacter indicus]|uniref:Uncharacterized protein n=1 Tax=Parapedobacter indicus TaxID=1477437 RepID=A0A1I3DW98_9SPHI|nr:DUF6263 family protein [Parapedobacter indicus]PPL04869.1 hypothetical protein CLV26_101677 [Parapedobacter indicus]SFH91020.1 hypothetical protein SAMN05444682_101663 [Parapedobacter indicus]